MTGAINSGEMDILLRSNLPSLSPGDQGLLPMKLLAFDAAVNTTLELPFLRTSPDHGTGQAIAGRGIARGASMAAAIETAWELG